jgi:hypothetical protein
VLMLQARAHAASACHGSPLSCATARLVEANWAEHVGYRPLVVQVEVAEHSGIHCKRQSCQVNRSNVKSHTKCTAITLADPTSNLQILLPPPPAKASSHRARFNGSVTAACHLPLCSTTGVGEAPGVPRARLCSLRRLSCVMHEHAAAACTWSLLPDPQPHAPPPENNQNANQ